MEKPILLSGIQPSGALHIGNYLGAISQWVAMQKTHSVFVMIADLHAITVPQEPATLRENTLAMAKLLIACGIDPEQSVLFVQSHVPAHAELAWILNTITPLGELERMTQFKEKGHLKEDLVNIIDIIAHEGTDAYFHQVKANEGTETERRFLSNEAFQQCDNLLEKIAIILNQRADTSAGLLNYPVLMAADILLYQTAVVPVGEDQQQHLELTRTLAVKFNNRFGDTFTIPQALIQKNTARIMGLDDPTKKMSKSAASVNNYISLLDEPDEIRRKIKIAVTDSASEVAYDEKQKPAIANLMRIYQAFSDMPIKEIEARYAGKGYANFKADLAELLVEKLAPIQSEYEKLAENQDILYSVLRKGADTALISANNTLSNAKRAMGLME